MMESPPVARPMQRCLLGVLVLAVSAWFKGFHAFINYPPQADRESKQMALISQRVAPTANKLVIKLPKAQGFQFTSDIPKERIIQPLALRLRQQKKRFWEAWQLAENSRLLSHAQELSKAGHNVSEVFVRYEGKMPWKLVVKVAHSRGDFREAIRCQYNWLIKRSYKLYRKFRFWLPTEYPVQFGYTDTEGNIVPVDDGPLDLGTEPLEMKAACMFLQLLFEDQQLPGHVAEMRLFPQREAKKVATYPAKHQGYDFHRKKAWFMKRHFNTRIEAHKWYDPRKYRGRYMHVQKFKRGIVAGTGPSR
eukprot:g7544.t1